MNATSSRYSDFEKRTNRAIRHAKIGGVFRAKYQRKPGCASAGRRRHLVGQRHGALADHAAQRRQVSKAARWSTRKALLAADDRAGHFAPFRLARRSPRTLWIRLWRQHHRRRVGLRSAIREASSAGGGHLFRRSALAWHRHRGADQCRSGRRCGNARGRIHGPRAIRQDRARLVTCLWAVHGADVRADRQSCRQAQTRNPKAAAGLSAYVGRYRNDYYGNVEIVRSGDGLAIKMGPSATEYRLLISMAMLSPSARSAKTD